MFDQILFMELLELKERLTLNKKTNIYKVRNGFTFIGYRFFIKKGKLVIRITNKVKVRIKRKIKNLSIYDQESKLLWVFEKDFDRFFTIFFRSLTVRVFCNLRNAFIV